TVAKARELPWEFPCPVIDSVLARPCRGLLGFGFVVVGDAKQDVHIGIVFRSAPLACLQQVRPQPAIVATRSEHQVIRRGSTRHEHQQNSASYPPRAHPEPPPRYW